MVEQWCKYALIGLGMFIVGRFTGVYSSCKNPEMCEVMDRYFKPHHHRHHEYYGFHIPGIDERKGGWIGEHPS